MTDCNHCALYDTKVSIKRCFAELLDSLFTNLIIKMLITTSNFLYYRGVISFNPVQVDGGNRRKK